MAEHQDGKLAGHGSLSAILEVTDRICRLCTGPGQCALHAHALNVFSMTSRRSAQLIFGPSQSVTWARVSGHLVVSHQETEKHTVQVF